MITVKLRIRGKVQGVGYRYHVKHLAHKMDVRGYAKNMNDGSIEIIGQAFKEKTIEEFARECRRGPFLSKVEKVDEEKIENASSYSDFSVI